MRILHILNGITSRGNGIVNTTVDLAIEQARQGHVVTIASAGGDYERLLSQFGVSHLKLDQACKPLVLCNALSTLHRFLCNLSTRPDLIHAHTHWPALVLDSCASASHSSGGSPPQHP